MADGVYSALSGAISGMQELDTVANNLANVSTPGFRAERTVFHEVLANAQGANGLNNDDKSYSVAGQTVQSTLQGPLQQTGEPLDVALNGPGYFVVKTADGDRLTRNGSFTMDTNGFLSTRSGQQVMGVDNKPIQIGDVAGLSIDRFGVVQSQTNLTPGALSTNDVMGQIKVVDFAPGTNLQPIGQSMFTAPAGAQVQIPTNTQVHSGQVELANANPVEEMVRLIQVNRLYDATINTIQTYQNIDSQTASGFGER